MKYLGIDYGEKRVGVAISNDECSVAFPREVLPNDSGLTNQITEICVREKVGAIVIGESKNFEGKENLDKAMKQGKGVIAISAHFCTFPLMLLRCRRYSRSHPAGARVHRSHSAVRLRLRA